MKNNLLTVVLVFLLAVSMLMPAVYAESGSSDSGADGTGSVDDGAEDSDDGTDDSSTPGADDSLDKTDTSADGDDDSSGSTDDSADDGANRMRRGPMPRPLLAGERMQARGVARDELHENRDERKGELKDARGQFKSGRMELRGDLRTMRDAQRTCFMANSTNSTPGATCWKNLDSGARKELQENFKKEQERIREEFKTRSSEIKEQFKQNRERIVEQFKADKERIKTLREEYKDDRDEFKKSREDVRAACKDGARDDDTCKRALGGLNSNGKNVMGNAAEQTLRILTTLKTRVQTNPDLSSETAADVVVMIDERIASVNDAQDAVDALTNESTINETKTAADGVRAAIRDARITVRLTENLLHQARMKHLLGDLNAVVLRLQEASEKLAAAGKDTTQLDAAIASFSDKVQAAEDELTSITDAYVTGMGSVTTDEDARALVQSTNEQLKDLREQAKESRGVVREALAQLRALSPDDLGPMMARIRSDREQEIELEVEA